MKPSSWQRALRAQSEARPTRVDADHARLMFVVCSESVASTGFVAAFPSAFVMQTIAGPPRELDAAARATLELAVLANGVRHVVVCGHDGCRACATREASQRWSVERSRALQDDEQIGGVLRGAGVTVRALWLDEASGEISACSFDGRAAKPMDEAELAAMLRAFDELSA